MKVIIVGGVAGGATAAARLRRLDEDAEIIILERSGYISYANCGLPYYIGGKIMDRGELTLQTPESFFERFRINVRTGHEAVSIDKDAKTVTVKETESGKQYAESYDKLILSPGAKPVVPDMPGADGKNVFTLRTVEDTFRIYDHIAEAGAGSAVVIGGGFIGLEMAENLRSRGMDVTLLQRSGHVMPPLDGDMAALVHNYMTANGINLRRNCAVERIEDADGVKRVITKDGKPAEGDIVIMAVGVVPENTLAKESGLELGIKGAIKTDEHMETSEKDIYAVGDAVEVKNFVSGEQAVISLAGPANKQGRIAADNICGIKTSFKGSQGSSVLKLFDMTIASTGLNERSLKAAGTDYDYVITSGMSHAAYYPGAEPMTIKVLFEKRTGRILGAQIIGSSGADKRIDVLATAIRAGMTAYDLTELDLAYAPPYSSAKDPVNMAGYVIENLLTGKVKQISWQEAENLPEGSVLLDTRTDFEYNTGHIEGAIHIPVDDLRDNMDKLPEDRTIYVYCHSGLRSYIACRILSQNGFDCFNIAGGYGFFAQIKAGM